MIRRATTWLTLALYGVIALAGQGLHAWVHEDCHNHGDGQSSVCMDLASASDFVSTTDGKPVLSSPDVCCEHDPDHCAICQHHSLGQVFVAAPPTEVGLEVCELLSLPAPELVIAPTIHSASQPRAPPVS